MTKAFVRRTSWSYMEPNKLRVELEVEGPGEAEQVGFLFSGNYVHVYKESRWDCIKNYLRRRK